MIARQNAARFFRIFQVFSGICAAMVCTSANADEFALSVSPPRFEISAEPGKTVRSVVELANASNVATALSFSTAEWELTPDGGVITSTSLKPNSCRPWVAIERQHTTLQGKAQLRYRFEVTPPPDATPTECRFAILISGGDNRVSPTANTSFPVAAQIALIVYVKVGDVKPEIKIVKAEVASVNGMLMPVLTVQNTGAAHGRLTAFLSGTDANGKKREFAASTLPILPGETRKIALSIDNGSDAVDAGTAPPTKDVKPDTIAYPLKISGTISDTVNSFKFDGVFEP